MPGPGPLSHGPCGGRCSNTPTAQMGKLRLSVPWHVTQAQFHVTLSTSGHLGDGVGFLFPLQQPAELPAQDATCPTAALGWGAGWWQETLGLKMPTHSPCPLGICPPQADTVPSSHGCRDVLIPHDTPGPSAPA